MMTAMRRPILAGTVLLVASCSGGGGSGGASGPAASPTGIAVHVPAGIGGSASLAYDLAGGGHGDVVVEYSVDGGTTWSGAAPAAGCPTNKGLSAPGSYTYLWDTVADGVAGPVQVRASVGRHTATTATSVANTVATWLERSATIDAATVVATYPGVHAGHYDLSPVVQRYADDPAFAARCAGMGVRYWRISVGRWEVGPVAIMAPEAAAYSNDPEALKTCSREFYRGPPTLAGAQDPANYHFGYLDAAIAAVESTGAEPYLCFDYMPFTLAANQDPSTAANLYLANPDLSFSNGIRTSPPLDDAVYAEVVARTMMHVNGAFAGGLGRSIRHVEIGNEPDLPAPAAGTFWTGTRAQFSSMYQAVSAVLDARFGSSIRICAGSFAFLPGSSFMGDFLAGLGGARLDAISFHAYDDVPETYLVERITAAKALRDAHVPGADLHCSEWSLQLDGGGPKFQSMAAALHHAKALEYFTLLGVGLSHRAVLRDPVAGNIGDITVAPARLKPAGGVFAAYELLGATPQLLSIQSISPAGKAMLMAGRSADAITVVFFHEKPPAGSVGRCTIGIPTPGFAGTYAVDRWLLTDATCANGDGLWHTGTAAASGGFTATLQFTEDTLVVLRLAPAPVAPSAAD